ncbi:MAG: hypothetical protein WD512_07160 [Candidatus Paceibacterota bacterium]
MNRAIIKQIRGSSSKGVQIPKRLLSVFACKNMENLTRYLSPEEIEFFRAFLLDYDIFSTIIVANYGEKNWADICFSTSKALYSIITNDYSNNDEENENYNENENIFYDGDKQNLKNLKNVLNNSDMVFEFNINGTAEGHGFVIYPVRNDMVFLIQSAGGIMTANMRLMSTDYFLYNLQVIADNVNVNGSKESGQNLFGYYIDDNVVQSITYIYGPKSNVNIILLEQHISQLSPKNIKALQKAFDTYFDDYNIVDDIELSTEADLEKPDYFVFSDRELGPYYFVDPINEVWICVDKASKLPHSTVSIGIRHEACYKET